MMIRMKIIIDDVEPTLSTTSAFVGFDLMGGVSFLAPD